MHEPSHPVALPSSEYESVRKYPRTIFSVPIQLQTLMAGGVRTSRGVTLDVCEGGLGALVQSELRVGEIVEIDLELQEHKLTAVAIVRHSSNSRSGFEFLGLTSQERERLAEVVAGARVSSRFGNA